MLEDATFDLDCPTCNFSFPVRADQVGTIVTCPKCGQKIKLKDKGFSDAVHDAESQINHLFDGLK